MSKQINKIKGKALSSKELLKKKNILDETKAVLKREFVGLDTIIDEIIHSIEAWYIYPEGQIRPTVINLFGMTGVGKTSLVSRLTELIGIGDKLFRFDIGDYSTGDENLKSDFSEKLKNNSKQPIVIMFDEFQLGRTIAENGSEIDRNGLRALWDLLDTGEISIINESYYTSKVVSLLFRLQFCVDQGVESLNGKIKKNVKIHSDMFYNTSTDGKKVTVKNEEGDKVDTTLFIPKEYIYYIKNISENPLLETPYSINAKLMSMNHKEVIDFLHHILKKSLKPVVHDFTQSLIFVIGNLDEVYTMSDVIDPDYDADIFYKNSLNITTPRVKEALQKRFRVEQIARLGNNHIIYPSFSSESYRDIIKMELNKFISKAEKRYGLSITFDETVNDILYREGVFPTQGTRPIFTTINNLVESYISKIVCDIILNNSNADKIDWKFIDDTCNYEITVFGNGKELFKKDYALNLKIDNLRKSTKDDMQAHTAVHEAGHAVIACMYLGIAPEEVVSKTAGTNNGYCRVKYPEVMTSQIIKKDIAVGLGGYVAEELVFGKDLLSNGSYRDIEMITEKAISFTKNYGMSGLPIKVGIAATELNDTHFFDHKPFDKQVCGLIKSHLKIAQDIIKRNETLLLKMSEYLSENSRMDTDLVLEFVKKYGKNTPDIKKPDEYYQFKNILSNKIKNISKKK